MKMNKWKSLGALLVTMLLVTACSGGELEIVTSTEPPLTTTTTAESTTTERTTTETETAPPETTTEITTTQTEAETTPAPEASTGDNNITLLAKALLGIDFADGGTSPQTGFDNSGFIYYVLRENGYQNCPRGLGDQSVMGNKVSGIAALIPGDLVFFSEGGSGAEFGGIYIGDGRMIFSPQPGQQVREAVITSGYYADYFYTAVRVL